MYGQNSLFSRQQNKRVISTLHSSIHVKIHSPQSTFASLDALDPCVFGVWVTCIAAVFEPSAVWSATAAFAGSIDTATFGAPCTAAYRGCTRRYRHSCIKITQQTETLTPILHRAADTR